MIDKWLIKIDQLNQRHFFWLIVAFSLLLATWMQYIQHGWINPDSVLYFEQARLFALNDWQGIIKVYEWPFYGICIGIVHKLTSLEIQTSAQLLNILFFGIATASFLQLIKLAGGNNRTWLMGTILLFSSQYIVGDVLEMLMRDEGFWAFYLSALVFFIRYILKQKLYDAVLWQICIVIATLFRIEAILFLMFLPLIFYTFNQKESSAKHKLHQLLQSYSISLFLGIVIAIAIYTQPQLNMSHFGRLDEIFTSSLYQQFTQKLLTQAEIMSDQVLGDYLDEYALPSLLLTFIYVIGSKILTATGLIGTGLAFLVLKNKSKQMTPVVRTVFIIVCIIAVISMALIIIKVFVLSSRYAIALAWILLIFASFYLSSLSSNTYRKRRFVFIILCIILSLGFIKNILPKRDGYNYQQDAVKWIQAYNKDNNPVFYDDPRMIYYANSDYKGKWDDNWQMTINAISNEAINNSQLLAISHAKKSANHLKLIAEMLPHYQEIKRFNNYKSNKFIVIYQKKPISNNFE